MTFNHWEYVHKRTHSPTHPHRHETTIPAEHIALLSCEKHTSVREKKVMNLILFVK